MIQPETIIKAKYYLRQVTKRFLDKLSFTLFCLTAVAFCIIFFPHLLDNIVTTVEQTTKVHITGSVYTYNTPNIDSTPLPNVRIRSGGAATTTDSSGHFSLHIWGGGADTIPLTLHHRDYDTLLLLPLTDKTGDQPTLNTRVVIP